MMTVMNNDKCPFCYMSGWEIELANAGSLCHLYARKRDDSLVGPDDICMYADGESLTNEYYPKFCPECGRRINEDVRGD